MPEYYKTVGGIVEQFVERALPASHWGAAYFDIRLMELSLIDTLLDRAIERGGQRFLDFGCGLGLACVYASEFFERVEGVDIEEIGVAYNVDRPAPLYGMDILKNLKIDNVSLSACDTLEFLSRNPEAYDMILSVFVLEHVDDISSACERLARAMKPGGRAVHIVPNTHDTIIQLLVQNLQPTEQNERDAIATGRGLRKLGGLYAPITHSEFIDDYRKQFEINAVERFIFPMMQSGLRIRRIVPMREHSYGLLVEKPAAR